MEIFRIQITYKSQQNKIMDHSKILFRQSCKLQQRRRSKTQTSNYDEELKRLPYIRPTYFREPIVKKNIELVNIRQTPIRNYKKQIDKSSEIISELDQFEQQLSGKDKDVQDQISKIKKIRKIDNLSNIQPPELYKINKQPPAYKKQKVYLDIDQYTSEDSNQTRLNFLKGKPRGGTSIVSNFKSSFSSTKQKDVPLPTHNYKPKQSNLKSKNYYPTIQQVKYIPTASNQIMYEYIYYPLNKKEDQQKFARALLNYQKFKKVVHAILFTIYLRKHTEIIRNNRKVSFYKFVQGNLKEKLIDLKKYFIISSRQFFNYLTEKHDANYLLRDKDSIKTMNTKIDNIKKLVVFEIECIQKAIMQMINRQFLAETVYYLCKHGSYASLEQINTKEQLNLLSISEEHGYIRADKHLERSAIISIVFIKIILYNILLKPEKLDFQITNDQANVIQNMKLVGNIIYQLMIEIQQTIIKKSHKSYVLGNWETLTERWDISPVNSMTIQQDQYQENELISGLCDKKFIWETYNIFQMVQERRILKKLVVLIHQTIVRYHEQLRYTIFIK